MRKVLSRVYCAQAYAAGEGGQEECTVHDGEDTDGNRWGGLLQDTAFQSDSQVIQANNLKTQGVSGGSNQPDILFYSEVLIDRFNGHLDMIHRIYGTKHRYQVYKV